MYALSQLAQASGYDAGSNDSLQRMLDTGLAPLEIIALTRWLDCSEAAKRLCVRLF